MVCPTCGSSNPEGVKFCGECGRSMSLPYQGETVLLDGPAAAAAARAKQTQLDTALLSPPPDVTQSGTWGMPRPPLHRASGWQPGSAFGSRYRIEALLGEGGMGAVYKAYDTELDRMVALKLVRPELATSPQTLARFKQELLLASKVSHKNVLRIHDLGA